MGCKPKKAKCCETTKEKKAKKGDKFVCSECEMVIEIKEPCDCSDICYSFICCDTPMKLKK